MTGAFNSLPADVDEEAAELRRLDRATNESADDFDRLDIRSIALSALGCGLGGLDWQTVRGTAEMAFREKPAEQVSLYSPGQVC